MSEPKELTAEEVEQFLPHKIDAVGRQMTSGDTEWEKKVAEFEVAKQRLAKLEADESEVTRLRTALDASNKILLCLNVVQADKDVKREVREQVAANVAALAGKGE